MAVTNDMLDNVGGAPKERTLWGLRLGRQRLESVLLLQLGGRIGGATAETLLAELGEIIDCGDRNVIVDLEDVDYISSAGLRALENARNRLTPLQGRLVLCGMPDPVRIAFDLAGLAGQFRIEPTRADALRHVNGGAP